MVSKWLNEDTYVENAEAIIKELKSQKAKISTSKIRNILSMLSDLYNRVIHKREELLGKDIQIELKYFKMRCAYESGRDREVKNFIEKTNMMTYIDGIGNNRERFILYYHYVEALVAYHRYYGGE